MDEINGMNTESAFNDEFAALEAEYGFNTEGFDRERYGERSSFK